MASVISASTTSTTALTLSSDTTGVLEIRTGSSPTTAMTIDGSQNVGIGVTPSAWSAYKGLELGRACIMGNTSDASGRFLNNAYYDGSNYRYIINGAANLVTLGGGGGMQFFTSASGTAGGVISFTQSMTLDSSGNLGLGISSPLNVGGYVFVTTKGSSGSGYTTYNSSNARIAELYNIGDTAYVGNFSNNPLIFLTNNTERMRIDSSGDTLIGTTSKVHSAKLTVNKTGGVNTTIIGWTDSANNTGKLSIRSGGVVGIGADGVLAFSTGEAAADTFNERMRITSGGRVLIGSSTSPSATGIDFLVNNSINSYIQISKGNSGGGVIGVEGTGLWFYTYTGNIGSETYTERMRITSGGDVLMRKTLATDIDQVGTAFYNSNGAITNTLNSADLNTYHVYNINATNNGYRFYVNTNGGIRNFSGNNTNLSDERTKTNIELSGSYLGKICSIPVKIFNYKDETEGDQKTLGVIAQDVEAVAPEFVNNDGWEGDTPEDGIPLKSVYTTDLMFALMKSIQELKAELDEAKAEIQALKGAQ